MIKSYLAILVRSIEVFSMLHIIERSNTSQMHLCSSSAIRPFLATVFNSRLQRIIMASVHFMQLDTIPLSPVHLSPHSLIVVRRIDLHRLHAFLRNSNDSAPPKLLTKVLLGLLVDAAPYGAQTHMRLSQESKERLDDTGDLTLFAKWVTEDDGKVSLGHIPNSGTSSQISPDCPSGIDPRGVGCIAILRNQLYKSKIPISIPTSNHQ